MDLAWDHARESARQFLVKFQNLVLPSYHNNWLLKRIDYQKIFKEKISKYDFDSNAINVVSHASGNVYVGTNKTTKKKVWGKLTSRTAGYHDACNAYLMGCNNKLISPCGPRVLDIYVVDKLYVLVVTEDADDCAKRLFPDHISRKEISEEQETLFWGNVHKFEKYIDLFYALIYHRTYLKKLVDSHMGNLLMYYNLKLDSAKALRIDIENAMLNYDKFTLLKGNFSKQVLFILKRTDTVLTLKEAIFTCMGYETEKQKLEHEEDDVAPENSVKLVSLMGASDAYFRLKFPKVKQKIRVHVELVSDKNFNQNYYFVEESIGKDLQKNFKEFNAMYKKLFFFH